MMVIFDMLSWFNKCEELIKYLVVLVVIGDRDSIEDYSNEPDIIPVPKDYVLIKRWKFIQSWDNEINANGAEGV